MKYKNIYLKVLYTLWNILNISLKDLYIPWNILNLSLKVLYTLWNEAEFEIIYWDFRFRVQRIYYKERRGAEFGKGGGGKIK